MGPASVQSSTRSHCGVKDPCFVSTTLLHFFFNVFFVYFPLGFLEEILFENVASNGCTEGTEGEECASFFSFFSVSAGTRNKGSNKLIGEECPAVSRDAPQEGYLFSLLKPGSYECFACGHNSLVHWL